MIETPETGAAAASLEHGPMASSPAPATLAGEAPATVHGTAGGHAPPSGPGRPARRLLVLLLVVACAVAVAAAAAIAVLLVQHPARPYAAAHPLRATVFALRPGQCFDSSPNGIAGAHEVPCAQPHDAEIYGTVRVAGLRWPGTAALATRGRLGCQARLGSYLNPQLATSGLAESYAYPNQGAWMAGAHTVICEIRGTQGKLTGSVRAFSG
jgi:Septum formation